MATAVPDSPVDDGPLKSAAGLKTAERQQEDVGVVDARKAFLIKLAMDVFFVVYLLFYIGILVLFVKLASNWRDLCLGVSIVSPLCVGMLCLTPRMKVVYIQLYATKWPPRNDGNGTEPPASEKQGSERANKIEAQ